MSTEGILKAAGQYPGVEKGRSSMMPPSIRAIKRWLRAGWMMGISGFTPYTEAEMTKSLSSTGPTWRAHLDAACGAGVCCIAVPSKSRRRCHRD